MTELHVRLADLRDAAQQLRQSNRVITASLTHITGIINELTALGMEPHHFTTLGAPQMHLMTVYADQLNTFADSLSTTATDLELAVNHEFRIFPHFDLSLLRDDEPHVEALARVSAPEPATMAAGPYYISPYNQNLYHNLQEQQALLEDQRTSRQVLIDQRDAVAADLQATRNRALSHDPDLDLSGVPRVQALEAEIARYDAAIAEHDATIASLETSTAKLDARLALVQPAPGADIETIAGMQNSQTSPHVVANTYDCVNHVVQKLPVPANMALDAHHWNELVSLHPEFGISVGDQPLEGAVIVLERDHGYADDVYGHLLYVESVNDGEIWVTDNLNPEPVRFSDITDETSGDNISYLYFPWHTRA